MLNILTIDIWRYIIVLFLDYCARINLANTCWQFREELHICVADYLDWRECYSPDHITSFRLKRENKNFINYLIANYFGDWTLKTWCSYIAEYCLYLIHSFHDKEILDKAMNKFGNKTSFSCKQICKSDNLSNFQNLLNILDCHDKSTMNTIIDSFLGKNNISHNWNHINEVCIIYLFIDLILQNGGALNTAILSYVKSHAMRSWHDTFLLYLDINNVKSLQADQHATYIFIYHRDEVVVDYVFSRPNINYSLTLTRLLPIYENVNTPRIILSRIEKYILPHI